MRLHPLLRAKMHGPVYRKRPLTLRAAGLPRGAGGGTRALQHVRALLRPEMVAFRATARRAEAADRAAGRQRQGPKGRPPEWDLAQPAALRGVAPVGRAFDLGDNQRAASWLRARKLVVKFAALPTARKNRGRVA